MQDVTCLDPARRHARTAVELYTRLAYPVSFALSFTGRLAVLTLPPGIPPPFTFTLIFHLSYFPSFSLSLSPPFFVSSSSPFSPFFPPVALLCFLFSSLVYYKCIRPLSHLIILITGSQHICSKATIKLVLVNAKSLNTPEKHFQFLREFHKLKANIVSIQETHFKLDTIPKFKSQHFPHAYHATTADSKTKGVSILISNNTLFQLIDTLLNPEGRYIFLKGRLGACPITIELLSSFAVGILILGGDFNVPLNSLLDSSSGTSAPSYRSFKKIRLQLHCDIPIVR